MLQKSRRTTPILRKFRGNLIRACHRVAHQTCFDIGRSFRQSKLLRLRESAPCLTNVVIPSTALAQRSQDEVAGMILEKVSGRDGTGFAVLRDGLGDLTGYAAFNRDALEPLQGSVMPFILSTGGRVYFGRSCNQIYGFLKRRHYNSHRAPLQKAASGQKVDEVKRLISPPKQPTDLPRYFQG